MPEGPFTWLGLVWEYIVFAAVWALGWVADRVIAARENGDGPG